MRKGFVLFLLPFFFFLSCQKQEKSLYTIGFFQVIEGPTVVEARKGLFQALEDCGLKENENIHIEIRDGSGDISRVQKIAQEFVEKKVDMIIAHSTQCLQAALIATQRIPIIFTAVANPYLAGAGTSAKDHLSNVTGVASTGPIKESLVFIKKVMPQIKRLGTLWTPSELNSEYYLELAKEGAFEMGLEIVAVPVANSNEVLLSAQILINKKIDAIYPISDNTINASFEALGRVAEENAIPLFGGFLLSTKFGACAAMGWDFYEIGYRAGQMAARVKNGEKPVQIPFQLLSDIKLHLNLQAAEKQGVNFSAEILEKADEIIGLKEKEESHFQWE